MKNDDKVDLNLNFETIKNHKDYKEVWNKIGRIEIQMIEKNEDCKHCLGDKFIYQNPYEKPVGVCEALVHVVDFYTWRVTLGFPSWNKADRKVFKIHCPDAKGRVMLHSLPIYN